MRLFFAHCAPHPVRSFVCMCLLGAVGLAAASGLTGCGNDPGNAVASYKDQVLSSRELGQHVPQGLPAADSAQQAQAYIRRWLREQYIADLAQDSLPDLESSLAPALADYRRKLIQLRLEAYLLAQHLDTLVSDAEIVSYHGAHIDQFRATDYLYDARYLCLPADLATPQLKKQLATADTAVLAGLQTWAEKNNVLAILGQVLLPSDSLARWQRSAPPGIVLSAAKPGAPTLMYADRQTDTKMLHYFYLNEVIRPGNDIPAAYVAREIHRRIVAERRYRLLQQYEAKYAQEAQNHPDVRLY
jgi:hypothetical protein